MQRAPYFSNILDLSPACPGLLKIPSQVVLRSGSPKCVLSQICHRRAVFVQVQWVLLKLPAKSCCFIEHSQRGGKYVLSDKPHLGCRTNFCCNSFWREIYQSSVFCVQNYKLSSLWKSFQSGGGSHVPPNLAHVTSCTLSASSDRQSGAFSLFLPERHVIYSFLWYNSGPLIFLRWCDCPGGGTFMAFASEFWL